MKLERMMILQSSWHMAGSDEDCVWWMELQWNWGVVIYGTGGYWIVVTGDYNCGVELQIVAVGWWMNWWYVYWCCRIVFMMLLLNLVVIEFELGGG